ncbi:hypothetical protein HPB50_010848 [Hyalomma asiaticum]|uniref:Uncharacterized protein n=1 Tax=Hyalomma asiaticum TaxID=266040 RepID=A0ACB7RNI1_HYAAI|nr:hypothetical protein HPB50_010848 [Hyalomma asiaticum]
MAASKVTEHFHRDCQYHSTLCTRCSAMVLCSDMCEHLKSSCDERGAREAAENVEQSGTVRGEFATRAPKALENMVRETMTLLKHSIMSNSALHGRMTEISRRIAYLRDFMEKGKIPLLEITSTAQQLLSNAGGIDEELETLKGQCADEFDQVQEDIESVKTDARACTGVVYTKMQNALSAFARNVTRCEFVVQEMGSLEETAMRYGEGFYCDRLTNLRWYNMYPGVALQKRGEVVFLHLFLELVKGELDDVLHWPFSHFVKCTFLHHYTGEHHILIGKPTRDSESLQKPTGVVTNAFMFPECVPLEVLKSGGYVHDDELRVIWQLL